MKLKKINQNRTNQMKMSFMFFMKCAYRLLAVMAFSLTLQSAVAQQGSDVVTGVVKSSIDSEPLIGVSVVLKGSSGGTLTDADGKYSIRVSGSSPVLVFSYVGHAQQEAPVNQRRVIDITLEGSSSTLNEVVVTALGIQREKKSLGYSVGVVGGESIVKVAQENVFGGLMAKMPGVTMNQVSGPGSSVSMIIRGANSLTTDNQPLFVVDGVPISSGLNNQRQMGDRNVVDYGNAISDINPDDIESISVLKGPSAAALYGSRAGNGVVLIKTKSGQAGRTTVNFSTSNIFETPTEFLDFHYKYASGNRGNIIDESSAYWTGLPLDQGVKAVQWNSPVDASGKKIPTELVSYKDNMKNFLRTGITSTNNLSVSGGNERGNYRVSYSNMLHYGMIPNSDLKRNSFSTVLSYALSNKLRFSSNLNISRSNADNRPTTSTRTANPLEAVMAYPHVNILELKDYWNPGQENIMQRRVFSNVDNPYFLAYELNNGFVRDRVYGNIKLDWDIAPNLTAFGRVSMDKSDENRETKVPMSYARAAQGGYYIQGLRNAELNTDFLVTYKRALTDFDFSVSAGGNYMHQSYRDNFTGGAQLTIPGLYRVGNIPNNRLEYSNYASDRAIYSVYGMASLGFKSAVYLDLTARNDWASSLPVNAQSFFYPSVSLSWLVNETFKLPSQISLLKLRGGWAQVGNAPGAYQIHQMLNTTQYGTLITSEVPAGLRNPSLKPEIATSSEFGLELNMYKNRLRFEATYYNVGNKNQQLPIPLPESSGFTSTLVNAGLIESKGWELVLGGTPVKDRAGFTWDVSVNLYRNRTYVRELVDGFPMLTLWDENGGGSFAKVGERLGNLYSRGYARVEDPNSPYYKWPILDNNGKWINVNDPDKRVNVGNYNPDFQMGLQTGLQYKKFSLSASFDWRQGGEFMSFTYRYGGSNWQSARQMRELIPGGNMNEAELIALLKSNPEKYIIPQNGHFPRVGGYDEASGGYFNNNFGTANEAYDGAFIPGVIANGDGTYREHLGGAGTVVYPVSSQFPWSYNQAVTFDASFIKLREIALGYDLPKFGGFRNARVSVFSRNILLWTAAKIGIDPERAFMAQAGTQGNTSTMMRQGIELQNILPITSPIGFKLDFTF
jgi:TonB-linked SusC/RagA family outer membrane protein